MQPYINEVSKNPAVFVMTLLLGAFIVVILKMLYLIGKNCVANVRESGKVLMGIAYGACGWKLEDKTPEKLMDIREQENGNYLCKTNKGRFITAIVSHDESKAMINPYCHMVERGDEKVAIVYSLFYNDYNSISEAVNKYLQRAK